MGGSASSHFHGHQDIWLLLSEKREVLALLAAACGPFHGLPGESVTDLTPLP